MAGKELPDAAYLRECFDYDPETGALTWKHRPREHFPTFRAWRIWNGRYGGKLAGNVGLRGYIAVSVNDRLHTAHRIIWAMQTGAWPEAEVDHVNGNRIDNIWCNLRAASRMQNAWNIGKYKGELPKGVERNHKRYTARMRVRGKRHYLGTFDTVEDARRAVQSFALKHQGQFYHGVDRE